MAKDIIFVNTIDYDSSYRADSEFIIVEGVVKLRGGVYLSDYDLNNACTRYEESLPYDAGGCSVYLGTDDYQEKIIRFMIHLELETIQALLGEKMSSQYRISNQMLIRLLNKHLMLDTIEKFFRGINHTSEGVLYRVAEGITSYMEMIVEG